MSKIRLTYFDTTGRGELTRILLAYGGIDYEDKRIKGEQWKDLKPKTPLGGLPILEIDGKTLGQSTAIAHLVAKRAGLCGKNDVEAAQAEMVAITVAEMINKFASSAFEKDEALKAKKMEEYEKEYLPDTVRKLEALLKKNGGEWFAGSELSWGDIAVAEHFDSRGIGARAKNFDLKKTSPAIAAHVEKVNNIPKIKKWLQERPH